MSGDTRPFHVRVAEQLIEQLREGVAPWQDPAGLGRLPLNPTTGNRYRGINAIHLMAQQRSDPRWLTYRQALSIDAQVRKGERGTAIQYWKFTERREARDVSGAPRLDERGKPVHVDVKLARPRVFTAVVFNAQQMDGLPEFEPPVRDWEPLERAEQLLRDSGAKIQHSPTNRAFYRPSTDTIHLPEQHQYAARSGYYATALHELGHWTGHPTRLDRDIAHPFGSVAYAREELRAEIASMIMGHELGVGHDPAAHASYVASWIDLLQNEPLELFRAAADAEKINTYVLALAQTQRQTHDGIEPHESGQHEHEQPGISEQRTSQDHTGSVAQRSSEQESAMQTERNRTAERPAARHYLAVPYTERAQAKALGAAWDAAAKCWYARPGVDLSRLARWEPSTVSDYAPARSDREDFAAVLQRLGCVVDAEHPIMDGKPHRIRTEGDKGREKAGFYVGHVDGVAAGYAKNNRTGEETRWRAQGHSCSPEERAEAQARAIKHQQEREREHRLMHEHTAARLGARRESLVPIPINEPTPYLQTKGVQPPPGVFTDEQGATTFVPAYDVRGKLWSMQYIRADGTKRFAKNSRKDGCFHPVGGDVEVLGRAAVIIIAEGYATAATLSEVAHARGPRAACVAAFDSGNLLAVATALRERWPHKPMIIAADDDKRLELTKGVNPGQTKARQAAEATGASVLSPIFAPGETGAGLTDFNDLARRSSLGWDAAVRQVQAGVDRGLEVARGRPSTVAQRTHEAPRARARSLSRT